MSTFAEIKNDIQNLAEKSNKASAHIGVEQKEARVAEIDLMCQDEKVWSDNQLMTSYMQEKSHLQKSISEAKEISEFLISVAEIVDLAELENDHETLSYAESELRQWRGRINDFEISSFFKEDTDKMDCFIELNAGAGGTESQDWVEIMTRMYTMWASRRKFGIEIVDKINGEEAGIKNVSILIKGYLAYGYLKNENGIHRLVRISPFNAQGKRQTSFASVFCYPAINDSVEIKIEPKDLKVDTYRSSGAGGQHVNTTDSAVRITHIPTGIVAQSQSQRSQTQNKAEAMRMLKSKLYEVEMKRKNKEKDSTEASKSDISWGNQIRNYVLHPYQLIKDLRSGYETSQSEKVLDGDLDEIINSVIQSANK